MSIVATFISPSFPINIVWEAFFILFFLSAKACIIAEHVSENV